MLPVLLAPLPLLLLIVLLLLTYLAGGGGLREKNLVTLVCCAARGGAAAVCDATAEDADADVAAGAGVARWTGATRTVRAGHVVDAAAKSVDAAAAASSAAAAAADAATEAASCDHKPGKQQGPTNLPARAEASYGGDKQL